MGTNHLRTFKQINTTTSSSVAAATKTQYSLRHRAAVPAFSLGNTPSDVNGNRETKFKPLPPWNLRSRNQLERTQLNHRESAIALELLQDLAIPLDQLSTTNSHEQQQQQPSEIRDLLQHQPQFQSILSQHSPSNKNLSRLRPNQLSPEDVRVQDIQKEIIDLILRKIDSFKSDCDLLSWLDQQVLSQTRPSPQPHKSEPSPPTDTHNPSNQLGESFLHPLASELELDMEFEQDPEKMLEQPLCFTPLFSPILLHVMEAFSDGYKNPHLALYLFDWVRSHSDPLVKYFGLTRDVYLLALKIKWEAFQDFGGIHKDLVEMKALGLELDERFKRLIHHITRLVLQDEIQAERRLARRQPLPPHQSPQKLLDTFRKISPLERYHISQIESLLNQFIQNQDDLLAIKLRSPPPAPPHHT